MKKTARRLKAGLRVALVLVLPVIQVWGCGQGPQPAATRRSEEATRNPGWSPAAAAGRYDLSADEERGGHTLERHVSRSDEQLRERLQRERHIAAASTWTDRQTAEETIAEGLRAEHGRIEGWMRRGYPRANLALHFEASHEIGRSLRQGETQAVTCRNAVIVLRADGPNSFYVLTAYPEDR